MEENDDIIKKLAEGEIVNLPDDASEDLQSSKKILDAAGNWQTQETKSKDEVWKSLESKLELTDANGVNPKIRKRITFLRVGIAAVLVIAASWSYRYLTGDLMKFSAMPGEVSTVWLPDSTKVVLNAGSEISYRTRKYKKKRSVRLRGEGYFEVIPGNDFSVQSGGIITTVLGTSFNIYSRGKKVDVKCLTGKVSVKAGPKTVELAAGEMIKTAERKVIGEKVSFDSENAISWIDGKFYYENADLRDVIIEIENQFGVELVGKDFSERSYTGYFDNSSLESALNQVLVPMGYSYSIGDKTVSVN